MGSGSAGEVARSCAAASASRKRGSIVAAVDSRLRGNDRWTGGDGRMGSGGPVGSRSIGQVARPYPAVSPPRTRGSTLRRGGFPPARE